MPEEDTADPLLAELRGMWDARDPVPDGLAERALAAMEAEDLDTEYELLHLVRAAEELQGARGVGDAITIAFAGVTFSLLLRVSPLGPRSCRVDGWVTPAEELRVSAQQKRRTAEALADSFGRFAIPRLPTGLTRFWLTSPSDPAGSQRLFSTPTVEL